MIDYFLKGGLLMYPLAACSLIALAVILEKAVHFARARPAKGQAEAVLQAAREGASSRPEALCGPGPAPRRASSPRRSPAGACRAPTWKTASRAWAPRELKRLSHRLHWLELVGRIAPMLGLTGTVTGLTRAFRTVAALKQVTDPGLLASGIWEALITTIAGLFIGIPALIAYHLYDNRLRVAGLRDEDLQRGAGRRAHGTPMIEFDYGRDLTERSAGPDLTPMIDMIFQLLIFFLLTSFLILPAVNVALPRSRSPEATPPAAIDPDRAAGRQPAAGRPGRCWSRTCPR